MQNVNVEFHVKMKNKLYAATTCITPEDFFSQIVLMYLASDYNFIANSIDRMDDEEKKQAYLPYVATLKDIKQSILSSLTYELISQDNNIDELKVKCSFQYHENTISSLEQTVEVEIFNRNIRGSNFMAKDVTRVINPRTKEEKDQLNLLVKMYEHIAQCLEEAKDTIIINGVKLERKEEQE